MTTHFKAYYDAYDAYMKYIDPYVSTIGHLPGYLQAIMAGAMFLVLQMLSITVLCLSFHEVDLQFLQPLWPLLAISDTILVLSLMGNNRRRNRIAWLCVTIIALEMPVLIALSSWLLNVSYCLGDSLICQRDLMMLLLGSIPPIGAMMISIAEVWRQSSKDYWLAIIVSLLGMPVLCILIFFAIVLIDAFV